MAIGLRHHVGATFPGGVASLPPLFAVSRDPGMVRPRHGNGRGGVEGERSPRARRSCCAASQPAVPSPARPRGVDRAGGLGRLVVLPGGGSRAPGVGLQGSAAGPRLPHRAGLVAASMGGPRGAADRVCRGAPARTRRSCARRRAQGRWPADRSDRPAGRAAGGAGDARARARARTRRPPDRGRASGSAHSRCVWSSGTRPSRPWA